MICLLIKRLIIKSLYKRRIFDKKIIISLSLYTRYTRRIKRYIIGVLIDSETSIGYFLVILLRVLARLKGNISIIRNIDTTFSKIKAFFLNRLKKTSKRTFKHTFNI